MPIRGCFVSGGGIACAWALPPNHVSSSPSPSSLKQTLFAIFGPYGPIYFVAHTPNLLDVHKSYAVVGGSGGSLDFVHISIY